MSLVRSGRRADWSTRVGERFPRRDARLARFRAALPLWLILVFVVAYLAAAVLQAIELLR